MNKFTYLFLDLVSDFESFLGWLELNPKVIGPGSRIPFYLNHKLIRLFNGVMWVRRSTFFSLFCSLRLNLNWSSHLTNGWPRIPRRPRWESTTDVPGVITAASTADADTLLAPLTSDTTGDGLGKPCIFPAMPFPRFLFLLNLLFYFF